MTRVIAAFMVALAGCASHPPAPAPVEAGTCFGSVTTDYEISHTALAYNVALAQRILDARGIVPATSFCRRFSDVAVHVRDLPGWYDVGISGFTVGRGSYSPRTRTITLARSGRALMHEMLHVVEPRHDDRHLWWDELGYSAAMLEFEDQYHALD